MGEILMGNLPKGAPFNVYFGIGISFQFVVVCKSDKRPTALLTWKGGKKI